MRARSRVRVRHAWSMLTAAPRTPTTGNTLPWKDVQQRIGQLIRDKVIVGHSLWQDLSGGHLPSLGLSSVFGR